MAIILMAYGNKEEEIRVLINSKINSRILRNGEEALAVASEKKFQIVVSDDGTHVSIIMACSRSVVSSGWKWKYF